MAIGFDFQDKISGSFNDDTIFKLRNNILSRLDSILYLTELMNLERERCLNLINTLSNENVIHLKIQHMISNEKTLFDSILYHIATIYDYIGCLSGYIFENKHNLKWNSLFSSCKDKNKKTINEDFKANIIEVHNSFADKLFGHRSYLIHYGTDSTPFRITHDLMTDKWKVAILCPKGFAKCFKHLDDLFEVNEMTIEYGFFWVLNEALTKFNTTLYKFKESIELKRKNPKGQEVIKLVDSSQEISSMYWNEPCVIKF